MKTKNELIAEIDSLLDKKVVDIKPVNKVPESAAFCFMSGLGYVIMATERATYAITFDKCYYRVICE